MLANLLPPVAVRSPTVEIVESAARRSTLVVHPRYRNWLTRCGLVQAADVLALRGEIVSGHHDRHVMRVELPAGAAQRVVYLKREHCVRGRVRRMNRRAGFGTVSRSEREAKVLERLEAMGLAAPQWIAYGECEGRAFLLIDELAGYQELRTLAQSENDPTIRREWIEAVGTALADLHQRHVHTPDVSAKHVYLRPETGMVTFIDWAGATIGETVTLEERLRAFAQLDASLSDILASPRDRVRALRRYLKNLKGLPPLAEWVRQIQRLSKRLKTRSSLRDQRAATRPNQSLLWLAEDEAVCVRPALAECWPTPAINSPFYLRQSEIIENGREVEIVAPDGEPATLIRWRSWSPLSRWLAAIRGRCWRSPGTTMAKRLFHDERHGRSGPKLLAFGQRILGPVSAESFVLFRKESGTSC